MATEKDLRALGIRLSYIAGYEDEINKLLAEQIKAVNRFLSKGEVSAKTRRALESELTRLTKQMHKNFATFQIDMSGEMVDFSVAEGHWEAARLENETGLTVTDPSDARLKAAASGAKYKNFATGQTLTIGQMAATLDNGTAKMVESTIRTGYAEGWTNKEIAKAVNGTRLKSGTYSGGDLSARAKRDTMTVVRTSAQAMANEARAATWKDNPDIVPLVEFVATMDNRVTLLCASLDGRTFKPGEAPQPPLHYGCRSTLVAKVSALDADIRQVRDGKPIDEHSTKKLSQDQPVSSKKGRTERGEVSVNVKFDEFVRGQSEWYQNDIMGARRAELYRANPTMKAKDMIYQSGNRQGRKKTLDELYKKWTI